MLVPQKRKCVKCHHEFIVLRGGFILKETLYNFKKCPACSFLITRPVGN